MYPLHKIDSPLRQFMIIPGFVDIPQNLIVERL